MNYLLDTHCIAWFFTGRHDLLPDDVVDDLLYYGNNYAVSEMSIVELFQLRQVGRLDLVQRPTELRNNLEYMNMEILPVTTRTMEVFCDLPQPAFNDGRHTDPFDRIIIATAINYGRTLISHDRRFPYYAEHADLSLLEI